MDTLKKPMDIYDMKLHEEFRIESGKVDTVKRVASGWIYLFGTDCLPVFVPYDNHFQRDREVWSNR